MKKLIALLLLFPFLSDAHAEYKNETEAGVVITGGNTETQTFNAKNIAEYKQNKNTYRFDGKYLEAEDRNIETAKNWLFSLRYERELSPRWSVFLAQNVEGDRFAGFRQRYNSDLGAKYFFSKREKDFIWFAEAGYRFTYENSTANVSKDYQKARLYTEAEKYWSTTTSTKLWVEYVPNFTQSGAWILNTEASVAAAMSRVFSIKTAYLLRHNNEPPVVTAKKTDTLFTTSLVAKF
jgi:putative salt-induced outer membrane protein